MSENNLNNQSGIDALARESRVDYRLRRSGDHTDEDTRSLKDGLQTYRRSHLNINGDPISWGELADRLGIARTTLAELRSGKYTGDCQKFWRLIDQFLADDYARTGLVNIQSFTPIGVARQMVGVISCAIKQNSMAAVIGPPGVGKTITARAFAADREKAVYIRIDETSGDARGVSESLWRAFKFKGRIPSHRKRVVTIVEHLRKLRSAVILIDESKTNPRRPRNGPRSLRQLRS